MISQKSVVRVCRKLGGLAVWASGLYALFCIPSMAYHASSLFPYFALLVYWIFDVAYLYPALHPKKETISAVLMFLLLEEYEEPSEETP